MKFRNLVIAAGLALSASLSAQSYPPAWSSASTYAIGDQVQLNGNVLRAVRAVTAGSFKYVDWELWDVRSNTTILIGTGGQFPTLAAAWNYALNCRIAQGASLRLSILAGHTEAFSNAFSLDHPFGARISISGASASNVTLNFTSKTDGFDLDTGHTFGGLSNLTINGVAGGTDAHAALEAMQNSYLAVAENLDISNFNQGFGADWGGVIDNISGIQLSQFLYGAQASSGGGLNFTGTIVLDGSLTTQGGTPAFGFFAQGGGQVSVASGSEVKNCKVGFQSTSGGRISADGTSVSNPNGANQYGYYAYNHGYVEANNCSVSNIADGFFSTDASFISANSSGVTGTIGYYGFLANMGGTLDITGFTGGSFNANGASDGSYIYGS